MADIQKIKLPNGSEYNIKDATARSEMEVTSHKVTAIDSAATDTQYPSAKAVYDAIQAAGQLVAYTFTDSANDGNVVITQVVINSLDDTNF